MGHCGDKGEERQGNGSEDNDNTHDDRRCKAVVKNDERDAATLMSVSLQEWSAENELLSTERIREDKRAANANVNIIEKSTDQTTHRPALWDHDAGPGFYIVTLQAVPSPWQQSID
jgi:hypothetical protein